MSTPLPLTTLTIRRALRTLQSRSLECRNLLIGSTVLLCYLISEACNTAGIAYAALTWMSKHTDRIQRTALWFAVRILFSLMWLALRFQIQRKPTWWFLLLLLILFFFLWELANSTQGSDGIFSSSTIFIGKCCLGSVASSWITPPYRHTSFSSNMPLQPALDTYWSISFQAVRTDYSSMCAGMLIWSCPCLIVRL